MFAFLRHLMRSGSALVKPLLLGRNKDLKNHMTVIVDGRNVAPAEMHVDRLE